MANQSTSKGFDKLIKELLTLGKEMPEKIRGVAKVNAGQLAANAKRNAPANMGQLRGSIGIDERSERNSFYSYEVFANVSYAAYVEFGTGRNVSVPTELQSLASEIRNSKSGRSVDEALASIQDWGRKKGLDEGAIDAIFYSIMRNGITPHPFLYPALLRQRNIYYQDLENLLDREIKRIK